MLNTRVLQAKRVVSVSITQTIPKKHHDSNFLLSMYSTVFMSRFCFLLTSHDIANIWRYNMANVDVRLLYLLRSMQTFQCSCNWLSHLLLILLLLLFQLLTSVTVFTNSQYLLQYTLPQCRWFTDFHFFSYRWQPTLSLFVCRFLNSVFLCLFTVEKPAVAALDSHFRYLSSELLLLQAVACVHALEWSTTTKPRLTASHYKRLNSRTPKLSKNQITSTTHTDVHFPPWKKLANDYQD